MNTNPNHTTADRELRDRIAKALSHLTVVGGAPPRLVTPVLDLGPAGMARIVDWRPLDDLVDAVLAVLPPAAVRARVLHAAADHLDALPLSGVEAGVRAALATELRRVAAEQPANTETQDTLPAWLRQRFTASGVEWERLDGDEQSYWEHQARAVRRAVARGGFRTDAARPAVVEQPDTQTREAGK